MLLALGELQTSSIEARLKPSDASTVPQSSEELSARAGRCGFRIQVNSCGLLRIAWGLQTQPVPSPPTHPWVRRTRQRTAGSPASSEKLTG